MFSKLSLTYAFNKGFRKGNIFYRYFFFVIIAYRVIKWLFAKSKPVTIEEYEVSPGRIYNHYQRSG